MGQTQSTECADEQGTYNLLDQDAVSDVNILRRLIDNSGPAAVFEYIDERTNRWTQERIKLAISGRSTSGKSTFINTIRNVKPGDDGFAKTGSGNTTLIPTMYLHPTNNKIAYYDLPGYSSIKYKKENYIRKMQISDYDFFFIFFDGVLSEDDAWLVRELLKLGKPFSLVRSKIDADINNAMFDDRDMKMILPEIKREIKNALHASPELKDTKGIFLISSRKPELGEMSDLLRYVEKNIGGIKAQLLLFSLESIVKESVERKYKMLKKTVVLSAVRAAGISAIPVPGINLAIHTALLVQEVRHYMSVFGINQERVYSLRNVDRSLLKCRFLLEPNFNMTLFVDAKIATYEAERSTVAYVMELILPLIGSVISSVTAARFTYGFLDDMLQDMNHDAMLIYEHVMKTNADHRM